MLPCVFNNNECKICKGVCSWHLRTCVGWGWMRARRDEGGVGPCLHPAVTVTAAMIPSRCFFGGKDVFLLFHPPRHLPHLSLTPSASSRFLGVVPAGESCGLGRLFVCPDTPPFLMPRRGRDSSRVPRSLPRASHTHGGDSGR